MSETLDNSTIIDLIRHGEPVGGNRYRGHGIDDPLSERGWAQMWSAVGDMHPWTRIVTSPLTRCRAFAEALGERSGIPFEVDERFREVGFGNWEGRTAEEVETADPKGYRAFYDDPVGNRPEGAEPLHDFMKRISAAYEDARNAHAGRHILIVAHAGVIRAVTTAILEAPVSSIYRQRVDNAGIVRIRHSVDGRVVVEGINFRLG
ncbi:MAG: histidine phosphatase family protein [Gammaproteobacteria bacterium]|nr:histidine phosphatase family protein [Gammaproteobacteria bacterium]